MDPIGHVNHPAYVDFFEEGVAQWVKAAGFDPVAIVPVAEWVKFSTEVCGGVEVEVVTQLSGTTGDALVFHHQLIGPEGQVLARGRLVRRILGVGLEDTWAKLTRSVVS